MNIIIPYRPDPNNGLELRYALRSIEKHLRGYDKIYVIADHVPSWLTGVELIKCGEESIKTAKNILLKMQAGLSVSPEALQWQDDIFLTSPLHVRDIKYWYDGNLETAIYKNHGGYKTMIVNTALKLTDSHKYYDTHTPIVYDKHGMDIVASRYDWSNARYLLKTLFVHHTKRLRPHEEMKDCKIGGPVKDIAKAVGESLFFSTSPQSIAPDMVEYLEAMYPGKSRWEK